MTGQVTAIRPFGDYSLLSVGLAPKTRNGYIDRETLSIPSMYLPKEGLLDCWATFYVDGHEVTAFTVHHHLGKD